MIFGTELCEQFVNHEIMSLAEDPSFKVRKAVAEHLVEISKVVAPSTFSNKMLPLYYSLARDTIWGVRKAAADSIVGMAKLVNLQTRLTDLTNVLCTLLEDISQWVQKAALQRLGEFIAALMPSIIPSQLVTYYATMAIANESDEEEVGYQCAYNFPGVFYACGKPQWDKLRKTYFALWELDFPRVVRTLCSSLHEVVRILGSDRAASELVPLFLENLQELGEGVVPLLKNAGSVLASANHEQRSTFLECLQALHDKSGNKWRVRQTIATHLFDYAKNYEMEVIFKSFWPLCLTLCSDNVWSVRMSSAKTAWRFTDHCRTQDFCETMKSDVAALAGNPRWNVRAVFCVVCGEMWRTKELLVEGCLNLLLEMLEDKVQGVRMAALKSLETISRNSSDCVNIQETLRGNPLLQEMLSRIREEEIEEMKDVQEKVEVSSFVTEEEASQIDEETLLKEIETEGPEKKVKIPVGIKIDEVDGPIN